MAEAKKKSKFNIASLLLSIVLLSGSFYFLYLAGSELLSSYQLKKELESSTALLKEIQKENIELKEQKSKLEDPEYVKSYARGEYMLSKEGEQIFYLPSSVDKK